MRQLRHLPGRGPVRQVGTPHEILALEVARSCQLGQRGLVHRPLLLAVFEIVPLQERRRRGRRHVSAPNKHELAIVHATGLHEMAQNGNLGLPIDWRSVEPHVLLQILHDVRRNEHVTVEALQCPEETLGKEAVTACGTVGHGVHASACEALPGGRLERLLDVGRSGFAWQPGIPQHALRVARVVHDQHMPRGHVLRTDSVPHDQMGEVRPSLAGLSVRWNPVARGPLHRAVAGVVDQDAVPLRHSARQLMELPQDALVGRVVVVKLLD